MLEMKVANKNNNMNDRLSSSVPRKQHTSLTNFKFDREDNNNNNNTIDAKNTTRLFRRQKSNSDTSHLLHFAARLAPLETFGIFYGKYLFKVPPRTLLE